MSRLARGEMGPWPDSAPQPVQDGPGVLPVRGAGSALRRQHPQLLVRHRPSSGRLFSQPGFFSKSGSWNYPNVQERRTSTEEESDHIYWPINGRSRDRGYHSHGAQHRPGSLSATSTLASWLQASRIVGIWAVLGLRLKLANRVPVCLHV